MTCQLCPLHKTRTKMCQGSGNTNSKILIIGEAPGKDEDKIGKPFVGRSGMLLDMWLSTLNLDRTKVFIDNVVKCIPLDENSKIRPPTDEEISFCSDKHLQKTLDDISIVITLGKSALKFFFPDIESLSDKVGKTLSHSEYKFKIYPLYHPSYFLRNSSTSWIPQLTKLYEDINGEKLENPDANSVLYYDLETTSLEPKVDGIKCIGWYSDKYKRGDVLFSNYEKFQKILDDHSIHVGYNQKKFDIPHLNINKIYPKGKQLDLIEIIKKKDPVLENKCVSFSLDEVCRTHGIGQKKEISLDILLKEQNTQEELSQIKEYCLHDVILTRDLFKFLVKKLEYVGLMMSEQDRMNYAYLTCGTGTCGYKIICNKTGRKEIYSKNPIKQDYEGARVIQPRQSIYKNINGYIFDFTSAYPHATMEHNLATPCKRTNCRDDWKNCEHCYHKNKIYTLYGYYCTKKLGDIEELLQDIFNQRVIFKEKHDPNEYGCKIASNAIYGAIANPSFESIYNFDSGQDTTKVGRERHKYAEDRLKEEGYDVIGGDTDSVIIIDTFNNKDKLVEFTKGITEELHSVVPFPQKTFELGLETPIKGIYFIDNKKEDRQNKKHYVYITDTGKVVVKGTNIVKLTATEVSLKVFDILKKEMSEKLKFKFKRSYIHSLIKEQLGRDITLIATRKRVNSLDTYRNESSLPAQISKRYGVGTHKLIKNLKFGIGKGVKYCSLEEAKNLQIENLDLSDVWGDLEPFIFKKEFVTLANFGG